MLIKLFKNALLLVVLGGQEEGSLTLSLHQGFSQDLVVTTWSL